MKIILFRSPKFLSPLLRLLFGLRKRQKESS